MTSLPLTREQQLDLGEAWEMLNETGEEELNPVTLKKVLNRKLGLHLTDEEVEANMKMFDENCSGTIDKEEFVTTFSRKLN